MQAAGEAALASAGRAALWPTHAMLLVLRLVLHTERVESSFANEVNSSVCASAYDPDRRFDIASLSCEQCATNQVPLLQ